MERELTPIQLEVREKMVVLAETQGLSLQEISDIFNNPISRSRVYQILNNARAKKIPK